MDCVAEQLSAVSCESASGLAISCAGVGVSAEDSFGGMVQGWDADSSSLTVKTTDCLAYTIVPNALSVFVTVGQILRQAAEHLQTVCRLVFRRVMQWRRYMKTRAVVRASCLQLRR